MEEARPRALHWGRGKAHSWNSMYTTRVYSHCDPGGHLGLRLDPTRDSAPPSVTPREK